MAWASLKLAPSGNSWDGQQSIPGRMAWASLKQVDVALLIYKRQERIPGRMAWASLKQRQIIEAAKWKGWLVSRAAWPGPH